MTAPVDVLKILDDAEEVLRRNGFKAIPDDLGLARAAVAELIEAANEYHKARNIQQRVDSSARLVSALARVKGA